MDLFDSGKRERRSAFVTALVLAFALSVFAAPVVEAAAQRIKGTVTAKIKDTTGDPTDSKDIGTLGLFQAAGSNGALAVRNFAGGGGFLGAGDCDPASQLPNQVVVNAPDIVTGIIVTGDNAAVAVSSEQVDTLFGVPDGADFPVANITTTAQNPTQFLGLGNGLTATSPIKFNCADGEGNFVVLGQ